MSHSAVSMAAKARIDPKSVDDESPRQLGRHASSAPLMSMGSRPISLGAKRLLTMSQAAHDAASPRPTMPSSVSTSTMQRDEPGSQPNDHQYGASIGRLIGVARIALIFISNLFERETVEPDSALIGNQNLRLQLDAFRPAVLANQAFEADRHVLFEHAGIGAREIDVIGHGRPFVREPDAVEHQSVTPLAILLRNAPGPLVELGEGHAGLHHADVMLDLRARVGIELALLVVHADMADRPGPRQVRAIAIGTDHVRVEGKHVAFAADIIGALLEPRIGALTCGEQPRLHPLAARADI